VVPPEVRGQLILINIGEDNLTVAATQKAM